MDYDFLEPVSSSSGFSRNTAGTDSDDPPSSRSIPLQDTITSTTIDDHETNVLSSTLHRAAVATLQEFDETQILAWVRLLRSLTPGYKEGASSESLSRQQLNAIAALRWCPDGAVRAWLRYFRQNLDGSDLSHHGLTSSPHPAVDTPSCDQWQGVSRSNSRTSRNSANPGGSVSIRAKAVQRPQLQAGSLSSPSTKKLEARRESPLTTAGGQPHPHWCTVCQTPSLIKTCDGWKRHEKEQHEKGYLCMPNGPIEATETGRYCAFCGQPNPDQKHLDIHGTELCTGKTMKDRRYTRRFQLVKHLETHGIFEDSNLADHLADSWQIKLRNRYYSCGFCVSLFPSNGDRLNHIDSYHFRRFESIDRWSPNMVIRGLLLQPAVLACWKEISTYDIHNANLVWEPEVIANLQPRLEISDEPAHQLATHAFYNSSLGLDSSPSLMTFLPRAGDPQTATSQQARFGREDSELTQGTRPGLDFFINTPEQASQMPAPSLPWNVAAVEPMDIDQLEIHPPQALTDYSCEGPTYGFVYNQSTLPLSPSDASTDIPRQPQHYPYTDPNLDTLDARNSMVPSQRQPSTVGSWRSSSLASTNTSIQSFPAPLPDRQYFVPAGRNYQSFSAHQSIPSSSTASINAYAHKKSPSFVAQLKRRLSRVKLRDASAEPDVPMDIDLDKLMRCMEHSQQSRTEIKHHHEAILYGDSSDRTMT